MTAPDGSTTRTPTTPQRRRSSIWPHVEEHVVDLIEQHRSTIVFANSRRLAERLTARLNEIATDRAPGAVEACRDGPAEPPAAGAWPSPGSAAPAPAGRGGHRQGPPRLGLQGAARAHRGRPQARPAPLRGRHQQPRARHRHGRGRPRRPDRVAAQRRQRPAARRPRRPPGRRGLPRRAVPQAPRRPRPDRRRRRADAHRRHRVAAGADQPARRARPAGRRRHRARRRGRSTTSTTWSAAARRSPSCRAAPYDATLDLLSGRYPSDEFAELRPRIVWDRVTGTLTGRPGRPAAGRHQRRHHPRPRAVRRLPRRRRGPGRRVGELDEEMVYESRVGDVFALGATSWRIEDITHDRVLVTPAPGIPGRLPFWKGDTLGRPAELGEAIGAFTRELGALPPSAGRRPAPARPASTSRPPATSSPTSHEQLEATNAAAQRPHPAGRAVPRRARRLAAGRALPLRHARARALGAGHQRPAARALRRRRPGGRLRRRHRDPDPRHRRRAARRRGRSSSSPTRSSDLVTQEVGGSALFAARFRECAARALLLPRRDPGRRSPLWQQRQRAAAAARGRREVPVVPDRARGGARVPPGRLRPARAGRR